ncbi:site-specific integrase [Magnetovibrio sp.]|uniref:tyrosine-type recombinase/integrase n=1 Tax=Magnetovibrio sp. TaxID=2024836 RepID=UPI002F950E0A
MARTVRDARIESPTARLKLAVRHEPYWRTIDEGMHLGYRKGKRKGSWLARFRSEGGGYLKTVVGMADDVLDADGVSVLTFSQAQHKARKWFADQVGLQAGAGTRRGGYRVRDAMEDYRAWFTIHRRGLSQLNYVIDGHIIPELGQLDTNKLTPARIRTFHESLASTPVRLRTRAGEEQRYRESPQTDDERRRRKASANKILNMLKAALNRAYDEGKIARDDAWRRVKPFREVNVPRVRYLTAEECRNLIKACAPEFAPLVRGAILTGCRYGELTHMTAGDLNTEAGRLWVGTSKNGKGRHVVLTEESSAFFAGLVKDKAESDLIFTRKNGQAWGRSHQHRRLVEACKAAAIEPVISFHILRHTHASHLAMNDAPLAVIARQLGHSDTRMAEKHYAHLSTDYISDTIRKSFPNIGLG